MQKGNWTFLSNHGRILVFIAKNPSSTVEIISRETGLTPRAVQKIIADLVESGYIIRYKEGRRNYYTVYRELPMRHPLEKDHTVGEILVAMGCNPVSSGGQKSVATVGTESKSGVEVEDNPYVFWVDDEGYLPYFY